MSWRRRLAIVLSIAWPSLWLMDLGTGIKWNGLILMGLFPVGLFWGSWWVWRGFANQPSR